MPQIKSAKNFNTKARDIFAGYAIFGFIACAGCFKFLEYLALENELHTKIGVGICLFALAMCFYKGYKQYKENEEPFRCGDCKSTIEKPLENTGAGNEAIIYHCEACDVLWHVADTAE
tara:strand:- start:713 stop:1066 length:354 start_codon:yes stop_codon:yes gene_type:complete